MSTEMLNLLNKLINNNISSGLTNGDLEKIGKKCLYNFAGVYPSDVMPSFNRIQKTFFSVIFNLSPHNESGSHFIAIIKTRYRIYFFDSLGKRNKYRSSISNFISYFNKPIIYCVKKIQPVNSISCSLYCLAFILHMQKANHYPNTFYNMFPCSNKKNDFVIHDYIIKEINKMIC